MRILTSSLMALAVVLVGCSDDGPTPGARGSSANADEKPEFCDLQADAGMWTKRSWGQCVEELLTADENRGIGLEAATTRNAGEDGVMGTEDDMFVTTIVKRAPTEPEK